MDKERELELVHSMLQDIYKERELRDASEWREREMLSLIYKNTKPWRSQGVTKRSWTAEYLGKPSSIYLELRLMDRYGELMKQSKRRLSKERLAKALSIDFPSPSDLEAFVEEHCSIDTPYDAFTAALSSLTGKDAAVECNHSDTEPWCKCKSCHKWVKQ